MLQRFFQFYLKESEEAFSFAELEKYVGDAQRKNYLDSTLKLIGTGSSRWVYELSNTQVIKVGINRKGEAQNETEYQLYHSVPAEAKEVLAAVLEPHDMAFKWIVMEKVRIFASEDEFCKTLGIDTESAKELFGELCYTTASAEALKGRIQKNIDHFQRFKSKYHQEMAAMWRNMLKFSGQFLKLCLAVSSLESNGDDLGRVEQLGFNSKGGVVIADYGFGHQASSLYTLNRSSHYYDDDKEDLPEYDKYGNKLENPRSPQPQLKPDPATHPRRDTEDITL